MVQNKIDLSILQNVITFPKATDFDIQKVEDLMAIKLPIVYKNLLTYSEGISIADGFVIYGTDEIIERNQIWEVNEYASGYLAIGDDGGGRVFLMLKDTKEENVFIVDAGDMNPNHATLITSDFLDWVYGGCLIEQSRVIGSPDLCDIVLIKTPTGGLKDLLKIKHTIGIEISSGDLLKASKNPPFILVNRFPSGKAKKLIEQLGPVGVTLQVRY